MPNYKTEFQQYNTSFTVVGNCNVITFINLGSGTVYVNNYPLAAGTGTLQIAGNAGEVDLTSYQVKTGSASANVWVIRKIDQSK